VEAYGAGQRDAATLYEYWVFLKLVSLLSALGNIRRPAARELLEHSGGGFQIRLRRGRGIALEGRAKTPSGDVNLRLSYNRTFRGRSPPPKPGSWTIALRPDYTLSVWPASKSEGAAEATYQIVHIHFDAKYRIELLEQLTPNGDAREPSDDDPAAEGQPEQFLSTSKASDILKMHAYRDAIRRSFGAYVLFPGDTNQRWAMYTELLPGLGAFAVRPGRENPAFEEFLKHLIGETANPATKRALWARETARIYAQPEDGNATT
jgi:predicted component of viral defense system (DUF524 family)